MRIAGSVLMILSMIAIAIAFSMDTSVSTYSASSGLGLPSLSLPSQVSNLGLMQKQMMVLHAGLAGFIAGAALYGMGEIVEILKPPPAPTMPERPAVTVVSADEAKPTSEYGPPRNDTPTFVWVVIGAFLLIMIILAITVNVRRASSGGGNGMIDETAINAELDAMNIEEEPVLMESNIN